MLDQRCALPAPARDRHAGELLRQQQLRRRVRAACRPTSCSESRRPAATSVSGARCASRLGASDHRRGKPAGEVRQRGLRGGEPGRGAARFPALSGTGRAATTSSASACCRSPRCSLSPSSTPSWLRSFGHPILSALAAPILVEGSSWSARPPWSRSSWSATAGASTTRRRSGPGGTSPTSSPRTASSPGAGGRWEFSPEPCWRIPFCGGWAVASASGRCSPGRCRRSTGTR